MRLLRQVRSLRWSDRWLLIHAGLLHLAVAAMIRVVPFGWVLRSFDFLYARDSVSSGVEPPAERRIVWAVRAATTRIAVGRTCLTVSMTLHYLLKRSGFPSTIRFGVSPVADRGTRLAAHAWVERGARSVIGGEARGRYLALE